MRRVVAAAAALIALAACNRKGEGARPSDAPIASADAAIATAPPPAKADVALGRAYRGKIGDHAIAMRLARSGSALTGGYFYESQASDLDLAGTIDDAGAVHLVESSKGAPTGAFDGRVDAAGAITGTWSDRKKTRTLSFALAKVEEGRGVTLVKRAIESARKTKRGDGECKVDVVWPEALGAFDRATEAKVNARLRPELATVPSAKCDEPSDRSVSYEVRRNDGVVLSVLESTSLYEAGMPHPSYGVVTVNVRLPTGAEMTRAQLFGPEVDAAIAEAAKPELEKLDADDRAMVKDALATAQADFVVEDTGVRFYPTNALPHAFKAFLQDGVRGPFAALGAGLRDRAIATSRDAGAPPEGR